MNQRPSQFNAPSLGNNPLFTTTFPTYNMRNHYDHQMTPIDCKCQLFDPFKTSLLNQRVVIESTSGQSSRNKRQISIKENQLSILEAPKFENLKESILELLGEYQWKIQDRIETLQSTCRQEMTACHLAQSIFYSITINMSQIQRSTSLQDIRHILDKLQSWVLDTSVRIQKIASPRLLAKFVNLRSTISLEISNSIFERSQLITYRDLIIKRIQKIVDHISQLQNSDIGQLSEEAVRKLKWGYHKRKDDLLIAKFSIERAQSNEAILTALDVLKKSIVRVGRTLKSVVQSPQRMLQEQVFTFLGKLHALRRELGDIVQIS